ncbi:MAG: flagellar assembly protein A [Sulfuricurvum sp.]
MADLQEIAKTRGINIENIDFDLLSFQTYFKGAIDEEWQNLRHCNLLEQTTESEIRSNIFLLRQEYQIRFREYAPHPYLDLHFTIATDKYKSKAVAVLDSSSIIPLKKGIQEWIKEAIQHKLLRHGLLIGLYDQNLDREINRLLLKIQKEGPLNNTYRLPIGEFFPPIPQTNDQIILHFQNQKESKSLIQGVQTGDLILEYIFPKHGRDGRGCDGSYIKIPDPTIKYANYIIINDETIETDENSESIRFYAKVSGFVERKKGIFTISQELRIDTANFKKTGSIEAGTDKDISLKINQKIASEDSVGTGVYIDVQKLEVNGTVGSHAKIQACELHIGAQTHKKSTIDVTETANIHLHRGNLKAKDAHIDILETGKIEADCVHIHKMIGGEIIAREVHIDILYSNARITALESISIGTIEGEGNKLSIDPHSLESYHENIAHLEREIKDKTSRIQLQNKEFITRQLSFKEKNSRIKQIQQRIISTKQTGNEPMKADLVRLHQYKSEAESLKHFKETLEESESLLHQMKHDLNKLYEADLHAVVTHNGVYNGKNRIIFIDPKTRQEYGISPEGKVTHIRLRLDGDEKKILLES